jgi:AcrR family transcriptional regulator
MTETTPSTEQAKRHAGRPREFDRAEALEAAMRVFWQHGYEGASLTELTEAMGISRPSLYAAFGDKAELFREALSCYSAGPGSYMAQALAQPTARAVVEALLRGNLCMNTDSANPKGCLLVHAAMAGGENCACAKAESARLRESGMTQLRERFERARAEGDLPSTIAPAALAQYVFCLLSGMSVQAASGMNGEELNSVVDLALASWPE